jgi:hypothetical protein
LDGDSGGKPPAIAIFRRFRTYSGYAGIGPPFD